MIILMASRHGGGFDAMYYWDQFHPILSCNRHFTYRVGDCVYWSRAGVKAVGKTWAPIKLSQIRRQVIIPNIGEHYVRVVFWVILNYCGDWCAECT